MEYVETRDVPIRELTRFPGNARRGNVDRIRESIRRTGQYRSIVVRDTGEQLVILAGNHTHDAIKAEGHTTARSEIITCDDVEARRINLADNKLAELGDYDLDALAELLSYLEGDYAGTGYTDEDIQALITPADGSGGDSDGSDTTGARKSLAERFGVPPFTVLDARQGYWQERKKSWLALGIDSGAGRGGELTGGFANAAAQQAKYHGGDATEVPSWAGTSIFDPVLCELLVRWYSAPGHRVIDPFAGGSVRGLVSARLGRHYTGIDLRPEQVEANDASATDWVNRGLLGITTPDTPSAYGPDDLTPIEVHAGYRVKRDDLFTIPGGAGGKVRTCLTLARRATAGLVTAGSRQSPQVNIVAGVAASLGLPCRVHVPAAKGPLTPELAAARTAGAEIVEHRPGYNNVIIARAREDAAQHGWTEIPFGMECAEAVRATAAQVTNLPADAKRLVVPVGSGMSLSGILAGLTAAGNTVPVLGVVVGADPTGRLDTYAPGWRDRVTLVQSPLDYHTPAAETELGDLPLDPVYEAKCLPFLEDGDVLWVVGRRETALDTPPAERPRWVVGDSRNLRDLVEGDDLYDFMLTCPPYHDLEVYSDDPADLSRAGDYPTFLTAYRECLSAATDRMRPDAFAAIVTGPVRDAKGYILDLPTDTTRIMEDLGWRLYQDAVLVTAVSTAAIRAARGFVLRKLTRTHQAVAVYHRGNLNDVRTWPSVEAGDLEGEASEEGLQQSE
ncbi:pyridoxal-phosphate dependent enzyme [Micromonospora lupini]|uniref:pyridoxal-phosphate dependent enzyme n=1 Tax=Micromonospora lupini TaxID=285679 RepID=UPI002253060B|nr:pyridoxal-phosphate dependent enzyme [Micromonospora lupini]MCX5066642.1 pyridoxal-phosphate dependent enzyme [Micromonospora lupini]